MQSFERYLPGSLSAALFLIAATSRASAQVIGGPWSGHYSVANLGSAPGVPGYYGGVAFAPDDASHLLIGGNANTSIGAVYSIRVQRDSTGHIVGFASSAAKLADAPFVDGGLAFAPGDVLLYTAFPINVLGQIQPGASGPSKTTLLAGLGVGGSAGGCAVVQPTPGGPLRLKLTSPGISRWYDAPLTPDGSGGFDVGLATPRGPAVPSAGSMAYVEAGQPGFAVDTALVTSCNGFVGAYSVDSNGDIATLLGSFVLSMAGCADGMTLDPLTGDLVIAVWDLKRIHVVRGFTAPARYCSASEIPGACSPEIVWSGTPSLGGADNFVVGAVRAPVSQSGLEIWSLAPAQVPYYSAFLCVAQPIRRIPLPVNATGGGPSGASSCTGALSHAWTHDFLADANLFAGSTVYTQFVVRNPAPSAPPALLLSNALRFTVSP
jgi:hypothetical protein